MPLTGYKYCVAIVIDHTKIDADLANWTLVFDQTFNAILKSVNGPLDADGTRPSIDGGGDVRFTRDFAGVNRMPCDIRTWSTYNDPATAVCEVAVRLASVSSAVDTVFFMWWGGPVGDTQPPVSDTYGQYNAYDMAYICVWPDGGGLTQRTDASFSGTAAGGVVEGNSVGKVGRSTYYDKSLVQYYTLSGVPIGTNRPCSIECITSVVFADLDTKQIYDERDASNGNPLPIGLFSYRSATPTNEWQSAVRDDAGPPAAMNRTVDVGASSSTWYFIAHTWNGYNVGKAYRDAALRDTVTLAVGTIAGIDTAVIATNGFSPLTHSLTGYIDELRISLTERSAAWLKADYHNQFNTANFLTFGSIIDVGGANMPRVPGAGSFQGVGIYGDGNDGAVTIAADTTLTRDMYYSSLIVNTGKVLNTGGFRVFVKGLCTVTGTISNSGNAAAGATAGAATTTGTLGGGSAGGAAVGGAGSNQTNALGGAGGAGGGGGGAGGTVTAPTAANGGTDSPRALPRAATLRTSDMSTLLNGGAGGGGGAAASSGAGGGGGGVLMLAALEITGTGSIECKGGAGGAATGGNGDGGAGGGGGAIVTISDNNHPVTTAATGGTGGAPAGAGTIGGAGSAGTIYKLVNAT